MKLINLSDRDLKRPVYRVFPMKRAIDLVSNNRLVLVAPKRWKDPYENLLYEHMAHMSDPESGLVMTWYGSDLFGSCWSWTPESDFAWRVYVPNGEIGVIVETTVEKLRSALAGWGGLFAGRDCFVGQVHYMQADEILSIITSEGFQQSNNSSDTAYVRAMGLLLKRPEFKHEHEVRVIVECMDKKRRRDLNLVDIAIDPNEFITRLTIDPIIDSEEFCIATKELQAAGFAGEIRQSELYRLPWDNAS